MVLAACRPWEVDIFPMDISRHWRHQKGAYGCSSCCGGGITGKCARSRHWKPKYSQNDTFLQTLALPSGGTSRVHPGPVLDEFIALYSRNWRHRSHTAGEQATAVWWLDGSPKIRLMISPLEAVFRPCRCRNVQGTPRACSGSIYCSKQPDLAPQ